MRWIVLRENINSRKIEEYDIFEHGGFAKDVKELLGQNLTREDFVEQLRRSLQYYFRCKCEAEVVICSWPVYIDGEELSRLNKEYEGYNIMWGHYPYGVNVNPNVGKKVDIYSQVMLNYEVFCNYVLDHKEEMI